MMPKAIHNAIHNATAKICEDIEQPPPDELTDPQPIRRCTRLLVIATAGALLVAAIVVLASRIPKLQTEKKTLSSASNSTTDEVKSLLADAAENGQNINCPCEIQVFSWCNVTTFHLYKANKGDSATLNKSRTFDLNREDGAAYLPSLCGQKNHTITDQKKSDICEQILAPVLNIRDSRTLLPTASAFTSPELLYKEIATRIDTNAYEVSNVYSFLGFINDTENFSLYLKGWVNLVRTMQYQFLINPSSSAEEYWSASQDVRANYSLRYGLGMDVSWETYLKTCKPAFCDVEFEVSVPNRVLRAMGQVGGITTVITLALKFLIWPSLRVALRFPTSKLSAASNG